MGFSSQHHSFDIKLAVKYGIEKAILIHHLQHWIRLNKYKGKNLREGRHWTYQTRESIASVFPYLSESAVRYHLVELQKEGVILIGCYNKSRFDKTLWYAFNNEKEFGVDEGSIKEFYTKDENIKSQWKNKNPLGNDENISGSDENISGSDENSKPIPDTKKKILKEKKTPIIPKGDEREACGAVVRLSKEEYQKAEEMCGKEVLKEIIDEMNDYCLAHGTKYKDYLAAIRTWYRKRLKDPKKSNATQSQTNQEWANKIIQIADLKGKLEAYAECMVFKGIGPTPDIVIKFSDNGFKEQVINRLRKMGIRIDEGLLRDGKLVF